MLSSVFCVAKNKHLSLNLLVSLWAKTLNAKSGCRTLLHHAVERKLSIQSTDSPIGTYTELQQTAYEDKGAVNI